MRHGSLRALVDFSPPIALEVRGKRDAQGRVELGTGPVRLTACMAIGDDTLFVRPEAALEVFVDAKRVARRKGVANPAVVALDSSEVPPGEHRITVNWISTHGPTSAQAVRVVRAASAAPAIETAK